MLLAAVLSNSPIPGPLFGPFSNAQAVADRLAEQHISEGWLLAESFGSQPAWALTQPKITGIKSTFHVQGLILAGGFVRHPFPWGVNLFRKLCGRLLKRKSDTACMVRSYEWWTRMCYESTSEKEASLKEFANRRTPADAQAALHRLRLIRENDPRPLAKATHVPVYYLGGVWDPLVPWYLVCPWLRHHCPGYQKSKLLLKADHNVLYSAPTKSAQTILKWLGRDD